MNYRTLPILVIASAIMSLSACSGDGGTGPNPVPVTVRVSQTSVSCEAGKSITLTATVTPTNVSQQIMWGTSNSGVATVLNGQVSCITTGNTTITASWAEDASHKATVFVVVTPVVVPQDKVVSVRVGLIQGLFPIGMTARITSGFVSVEAPIGADGRATLTVPANVAIATVRVFGDSRYDESRTDVSITNGAEYRFVMIPKAYVTPMGLGAGQTFPVSVDGMYRMVGDPSQGVPMTSWMFSTGSTEPPIHGVADFPHFLCFNRGASNQTITGQDSTIIWGAIEEHLHTKLGMQMFKPGTYGINCRAYIRFNSARGSEGWAWNASYQHTPTSPFYAEFGGLLPPLLRRTVAHELFHALGFGHTCSWQTNMSTVGCSASEASSGISVGDVAMFHLVREVRLMEITMGGAASFEVARSQ